ncbi:MAG: hypothetical protein WCD49_16720 [Candidatus Acidiferrales bacterium]
MNKRCVKPMILLLGFSLFAIINVCIAQEPGVEQPPDDVSGKWTIYADNIDKGGSSLKYVEIKQDGNLLTGRFKGPHQSGKIQGWVNVHHIEFSTDTRTILTFRGKIEGNTMSGLYGVHGRHAQWHAERTN